MNQEIVSSLSTLAAWELKAQLAPREIANLVHAFYQDELDAYIDAFDKAILQATTWEQGWNALSRLRLEVSKLLKSLEHARPRERVIEELFEQYGLFTTWGNQ